MAQDQGNIKLMRFEAKRQEEEMDPAVFVLPADGGTALCIRSTETLPAAIKPAESFQWKRRFYQERTSLKRLERVRKR